MSVLITTQQHVPSRASEDGGTSGENALSRQERARVARHVTGRQLA